MTFTRTSLIGALAAALLLFQANSASAQGCQTVAVSAPPFCPEGTHWERTFLIPEVEDGQLSVMSGQTDGLWLIFSQIPRVEELPLRPDYGDVAEMLADLGRLFEFDSETEVIEIFAPLGEDVAIASMAFYDEDIGIVTIYTYYAEGDARFVIQTSSRGATTLTDQHRDRHMQAISAFGWDAAFAPSEEAK